MKKEIFVCESCGAEFAKWAGKCSVCGEWNTLKEMLISEEVVGGSGKRGEIQKIQKLSTIKNDNFNRLKSNFSEFDLVFGGGLVPGSITLLGGEPGIGKSTLIFQVAEKIAKNQQKVLYASAEESESQIKNRADRLGIKSEIGILCASDVKDIIATVKNFKPTLLIIDSIQSIFNPDISMSAGSISQVKTCGLLLQRLAKESGICVILIGHVTKQGGVAGPKTLEHLVDAVAYLEGERFHTFRILRCSKNRFGSVNETGIFEMTNMGLKEVKNPAADLLAQRQKSKEGSAVSVVIEGTRPFLVEIQALASKSYLGFPQRKSSGFDYNRMQLILAVLSSRANIRCGNFDIFLNVVGGFKLKDPSCDLAAAIAIASAIYKKSIKKDLVLIGELGLSAEIRSVSNLAKRIKEAKSLGFKGVIVPKEAGKILTSKDKSFKIVEVDNLREAIAKAIRN
jgi:DNA repair protein RadA/Sms